MILILYLNVMIICQFHIFLIDKLVILFNKYFNSYLNKDDYWAKQASIN